MSLDEKISDLRWHVARTGHRDFSVMPTYYIDDESPMGQNLRIEREDGVADRAWVITCCGGREDILEPVTCDFSRQVSETEIASAGRPELADMYGMGALIESIKLEARREVPKVWEKVGELDIGEDDP